MSKAQLMTMFDSFTTANMADVARRRIRVSPSYYALPRLMQGGRQIQFFVTSEIYNGDERRYSIRAMTIGKDYVKTFHVFGEEGLFTSRKRIERAFDALNSEDVTIVEKPDGTVDMLVTGIRNASTKATEIAEAPAKPVKVSYAIPYGQPGYVPNPKRPTRQRLPMKDWPEEEYCYEWIHAGPGINPGTINEERKNAGLPLIYKRWAIETPNAAHRAAYAKWKEEGGEMKLAEANAEDDSETALAGKGVQQWSARSEEGRAKVAKAVNNIGELFVDAGEALMFLHDEGMQDLPQLEFEELVKKAGKAKYL